MTVRIAGARTAHGAFTRLVWTPVVDRVGRRTLRRVLGGAARYVSEAGAIVRDALIGRHPSPAVVERAARPSEWVNLQDSLSEWGRSYFSDNIVSNESSMLDTARQLERAPRGGAYIGVGPEQNFTYVAIQRPRFAVVVDVRRDNTRLHWLYRAMFEEADTRGAWLALLFGRPWDPRGHDADGAPLETVLASLDGAEASEASFRAAHDRVLARLVDTGLPLPRFEQRALERLHRRFFREQLDISFQLRKPSKQCYPTLRSVLLSRGPDARPLGFLGTASAYAAVRRMQQDGCVVPVVGDFTGDHTMGALARELESRGLVVGMLYASNVEQYIFEDRRWPHWIANLGSLPLEPGAVIVRSYLDQGRPHPRQRAPHRTTNVVQSVRGFLDRQRAKPYTSYWEVVTDSAIELPLPAT